MYKNCPDPALIPRIIEQTTPFLRRITRDEDAFQTAVMRTLETLPDYDPHRGSWFAFVKGRALPALRRRAYQPERADILADIFALGSGSSDSTLELDLPRILTKQELRLLTLYYGQNCSREEVAAHLGISVHAVGRSITSIRTKVSAYVKR